jgi:Domain of unknown function (DUF397)
MGMMEGDQDMEQQPRWRKSSHSGADNQCVELSYEGLVRDSKNPHGPNLTIDHRPLVQAIKDGRV